MRRSHFGLLLLAALLFVSVSVAAADNGVTVAGSVNGVELANSSQSHPVALDPKQPATLDVVVHNDSDTDITVRTVRLEGKVAGLTFYSYDTTVDMPVGSHSTESRKLSLDLGGLDGQATGLIGSQLVVLDANRHELASQSFTADVKGSLVSVYGLFGLAILVVTGLSIMGALLALARGRLHANRWRRGLRFLAPGVGVGLCIVFSLSAFRVLVPKASTSIPIVVISGISFFVLGYLTPNPSTGDDDDDDFDFDETTVEPAGDSSAVPVTTSVPAAEAVPAPVPAPPTLPPPPADDPT